MALRLKSKVKCMQCGVHFDKTYCERRACYTEGTLWNLEYGKPERK
jgi:hypothetical protein